MRCFTALFTSALLVTILAVTAEARLVNDMRGTAVEVPDDPQTVAVIDDGFIEGVMTHIGVIDRVKAIASWGMKRDYQYIIPGADQKSRTYRGWHTMKYLHPWLDDLPCINSPQGNILSFEKLAVVAPDVVILRAGDTPVGTDKAKLQRIIGTIEAMGFPVLVLYAPSWFHSGDLSTIKTEASIIGELFQQKAKAEKLADFLTSTEMMIRRRTENIPESDRPSLLYLGLRPDIRKAGGAGAVHGADTAESYIIEEVVHARNAWQGRGSGVPMSAEQIYALDPDVIILPTANGYHPSFELYESPSYAVLQELRAVKARKAYALPWSPMNASRRLEYPLDMLIMAKAAYPHIFQDINVYEFALAFYQKIYDVDEETARGLRSSQLLDWMKEEAF